MRFSAVESREMCKSMLNDRAVGKHHMTKSKTCTGKASWYLPRYLLVTFITEDD